MPVYLKIEPSMSVNCLQQAYVQAPLTHDRETVKTLLDEAQIGLAGKSTAIGDAIGLAVKRFQQSDSKQRVLILLTDGTNNAGVLAPTEAAELAAKEGLKIYTIGVGADTRLVSRDHQATPRYWRVCPDCLTFDWQVQAPNPLRDDQIKAPDPRDA